MWLKDMTSFPPPSIFYCSTEKIHFWSHSAENAKYCRMCQWWFSSIFNFAEYLKSWPTRIVFSNFSTYTKGTDKCVADGDFSNHDKFVCESDADKIIFKSGNSWYRTIVGLDDDQNIQVDMGANSDTTCPPIGKWSKYASLVKREVYHSHGNFFRRFFSYFLQIA